LLADLLALAHTMGDLQVAIGTGGLNPKKHGCCLDLRLATISLYRKQSKSDKKPNNLHYIFESGVPQSPAKPLQNLIVPKQTAANCRRWVKAPLACISRRRIRGLFCEGTAPPCGRSFAKVPDWAVCLHSKHRPICDAIVTWQSSLPQY